MIAPPRGSCLKWHASLGVSPCPGGLHLPGGQRQALSGTWGDRGPLSLVRGEPCQLLAQPGGSTPPPASHSPGRQQGCPPRAGERRPWEPGRAGADLSPGSEQPVSAPAHCLWPGCRVVSLAPVKSSLSTLAPLLRRPGPPWLSWADVHRIWAKTSVGVDFTEEVRTRFESRLSVELSEPHLSISEKGWE